MAKQETDLSQIIEALRQNPENVFFDGATEQQIQEVETSLNCKLPAGYRHFLQISDGAFLFDSEYIFGIADEEDLRRFNLTETRDILRAEIGLSENLLPFHSGGIYSAFDISIAIGDEYKIVQFTPDGQQIDRSHYQAESFQEWLIKLITSLTP